MFILCDIDSCVADVRELAGKYLSRSDWDEYFRHQEECTAIPSTVKLLRTLKGAGCDVTFMTGRPERLCGVTTQWLLGNVGSFVFPTVILMRPSNFRGSTQELKMRWLRDYSPDLVIEDDPAVVKVATEAGFVVLQIGGYRWDDRQRDYAPGEIVSEHEEFSFLANSANVQTPSQTLRVLTYEVGKMNELFHKAEVYGVQGYLGDERIEASDALSMLRMWFEHKGWRLEDMERLGEQHYMERMSDIRKHGLKGKLKEDS